MVRDILRLDLAVISVSKSLNRVEEIPIVTRGFHCSRDWLCDFVLLSDSK